MALNLMVSSKLRCGMRLPPTLHVRHRKFLRTLPCTIRAMSLASLERKLQWIALKRGRVSLTMTLVQSCCSTSFLTTHINFLHVIYSSALTYLICISFGFWFCFLNGNSGCLAKLQCRKKQYNSFNEPLKGRSFRDQKAFKRNVSAGFWTTTTCEMANSTKQSNLTMDQGSSSGNFPAEFVNQGLILWTQMRQRWVGKKKPRRRGHQSREAKISRNETYESLLTTNKRFTQPIPLTEMVDFLVDVWDQEGLYD